MKIAQTKPSSFSAILPTLFPSSEKNFSMGHWLQLTRVAVLGMFLLVYGANEC